MRNPVYITIEESSGCSDLVGISSLILQEFPNLDLNIVEDNSVYFVLHFVYEEFEEAQEVASTITYLLLGEGIYRFKITVNTND
jgi:hypothetical protein